MKTLFTGCLAVVAAATFAVVAAAEAQQPAPPAAAPPPSSLVVHEWGTFTTFAGSDGVAVGFSPSNVDLPDFMYFQAGDDSKSGRLRGSGTVSMETPVIYFYPSGPMQA